MATFKNDGNGDVMMTAASSGRGVPSTLVCQRVTRWRRLILSIGFSGTVASKRLHMYEKRKRFCFQD